MSSGRVGAAGDKHIPANLHFIQQLEAGGVFGLVELENDVTDLRFQLQE